MLFRPLLCALALLALCVPGALAGQFREGPKAVLELFTSQGCSSCPQADAMLEEMGERDDVITLARADNEWGSVPVAFIVGGDAPTPTLRKFAAAAVGRTSLPLDIVRLPALPLLPNGKPDRRALLEMVK